MVCLSLPSTGLIPTSEQKEASSIPHANFDWATGKRVFSAPGIPLLPAWRLGSLHPMFSWRLLGLWPLLVTFQKHVWLLWKHYLPTLFIWYQAIFWHLSSQVGELKQGNSAFPLFQWPCDLQTLETLILSGRTKTCYYLMQPWASFETAVWPSSPFSVCGVDNTIVCSPQLVLPTTRQAVKSDRGKRWWQSDGPLDVIPKPEPETK